MRKNKKKIWFIIILLLIFIVSCTLIYFKNRIYWKYNNNWIMGNQKNVIIDRYGEFDYQYGETTNGETTYGYLIYKDNKSFFGMSGSGNEKYYYIKFDENNIAIQIFIDWRGGG